MAYMSQEKKAAIAPVVKAILKKYKVKGSLAVRHHSTLVLNIKSGALDFIGNFNAVADTRTGRVEHAETYLQVNPYWAHEHYSGKVKQFVTEVLAAMNVGNHDRSDSQSDYFDVGWYVDVNVGQWDKPYQFTK